MNGERVGGKVMDRQWAPPVREWQISEAEPPSCYYHLSVYNQKGNPGWLQAKESSCVAP